MAKDDLDRNDLESLTEVFRQAGASDPEMWASSQIEEGINQLARFSFLKSITSEWLKENELNWVDNRISYDYSEPGVPCSQLSMALREMLGKSVSREAIIDLVRVIQFETLRHVCATINKTYEATTPVNNWCLQELDEDDNPAGIISALHESLLEFDPSGNEMRPSPNHTK